MSKVLVKFSRDWADEFQMEGFRVVDAERAEEIKTVFSKPQTAYFGTNEGWESCQQEGDGYSDGVLANSMEFVDISDGQATLLMSLFGSGIGYVPNPDHVEDEDEDEDE